MNNKVKNINGQVGAEDIDLTEYDKVTPSLSTEIDSGMSIEWDQAFKKSQAYQKSIQEIGAKQNTLEAIKTLAEVVK